MNDVVTGVIRWVLRLVVLAMGVLFFLSLLAAAAVLALVWGLRALWARLTGRPVTPWVMRMDPRTGWSTVYRSTARWTAQRPEPPRRDDHDVTDVVPREIR
ncbi:MAG TPA: hypothetical protein PLA98_01865 [Alicycliphilus sp.]|uniref:Uncharacterized protein n=1 Tax=Diaphorobacter limosus TaxID=3036128 RepID=A0ABZ0J4F1_9BURK|nr:hypothetical protein [Diaphorobacter sp. Y-1]MBP7325360.1 hypothetical protein [Alicycliphilus sp.]MCA0441919.1 hypothetical protein [Pseudomonadota bacterium]HRO82430.1 hypothetical protein [Alicycliphilus denitrificans]MBP8138103.1 hypothetical protein [Alicycliphilus sp.]WOO32357.1 hypothetical protein P4826_18555 [Diaphorobacter sp. Y-1]